jgi:PAS domain S-box-containing protein
MESLFEKSPDGVALIVDSKIIQFNPKFAEMMGRSADEMAEMTPMDFVLPDERPTAAERIRAVFSGGPEFPSEYNVLRPDGTLLPVEVLSQLVEHEGQPAILSVVRDISERRAAAAALAASEEKFRRLASTTAAAIIIAQDDLIAYANEATEALLGYSRRELARMEPMDIIHAEDQSGVRDRIERRLRGEEIRTPYQYRVLTKAGEVRWWETSATLMEYQGRPAVLAVSLDITSRVEAERALQQMREELEGRVERQMLKRNPYGLTFRELTVLHEVTAGKADKEIASELSISPLTVQKHVSNILAKMGASSRTDAGVRAIREQLLA